MTSNGFGGFGQESTSSDAVDSRRSQQSRANIANCTVRIFRYCSGLCTPCMQRAQKLHTFLGKALVGPAQAPLLLGSILAPGFRRVELCLRRVPVTVRILWYI